jgi:hypothetical protein
MICLDAFFGAEDTAAFEELADKISCEIYDDEFFTSYGKAYHESIIVKLLDKVIKDPAIYTPHVQIFYEGFLDYLYVAVVDIERNNLMNKNSHKENLLYFKNLFECKYRTFKYAIYSDYLIIIISSRLKNFYEDQFFDMDDNPFVKYNLYAGVSSSFENPYELRGHYDKAVAALKNGIEENSDQRIFCCRYS